MNSGSLILIVAMFALLWFLLIRPQRQRQQQQQQMLDSIRQGDEVLTVGGIYGIVEDVEEDGDLIVEIAEGIQVRMARRSVAGVEKPDEDVDEESREEPEPDEEEAIQEHAAAADEGDGAAGEETVSGEATRSEGVPERS